MGLAQFLDPPAAELVQDYFSLKDDGSPLFTGATFDRLAGGGDRGETFDRITEDDLVAVTTLSVQVPARAAIAILDQHEAKIHRLLREVPPDLDLHLSDGSHIAPGAPAQELWALLTALDGVGSVTAGKLLARKRPRLLPVYDDVVRKGSGTRRQFWSWLHGHLRTDPDLVDKLRQLRTDANAEHLTILRTLDVTIWMRNYGKKDSSDPALRETEPIYLAP